MNRLQLHLDALALAVLLWVQQGVQQGIEKILHKYEETA